MSEAFDAIVIGAGAAGLMCALTAGQRGRQVLLLDHLDKVGAKILISGGGRCNFTNLHCAPERFISANPHFHKSALDRYTQHDFIALVERHRIAYHEKTLGQLFCDGSARADRRDAAGRMRGGQASMCGSAIASRTCRAPTVSAVETDKGAFTAAVAGARDRRAVDPEDGRDRIHLRHRARASACASPRPCRGSCR